MSEKISLKDFYNNPEQEEDEDSEQDSDFVPDDNESDAEDYNDLETEEVEEEEENSQHSKKRSAPDDPAIEEESAKKSRIDAIWADMNKPKEKEASKTSAPSTTATALVTATAVDNETKPIVAKKKSPLNQRRPKSTLSSLVSQYNIKEPKLNTLEKSKLDWQGYVDREGIKDELKYKNKDGYMEKVAFLQRVDDRRLNQLKSGQKKEAANKK